MERERRWCGSGDGAGAAMERERRGSGIAGQANHCCVLVVAVIQVYLQGLQQQRRKQTRCMGFFLLFFLLEDAQLISKRE